MTLVDGFAVGELQKEGRPEEEVEDFDMGFVLDVVDDLGGGFVYPADDVAVAPVAEHEGQLGAFVYEEEFGFIRFALGDEALPVLFEKQEVELQLHFVAFFAAVEALELYGWEGRVEAHEKVRVEAFFDGEVVIGDGGTEA